MNIVVFGAHGQLGRCLVDTLGSLGLVHGFSRRELDITNALEVDAAIDRIRPSLIVNAAAYTAVDKAEQEVALAQAINAKAPGVMARAAHRVGALLIHYSTDYVFDGQKVGPYLESDEPNPLNVYGSSKRDGELEIKRSGANALIVRTTWVYSAHGTNFLLTILKLAQQREELRIIDDQIGAPTSALELALATRTIAHSALQQIGAHAFKPATLNLTAQGFTSWFGFAKYIIGTWHQLDGKPAAITTRLIPIRTEDYVTAARRPKNSSLCNDLTATLYGVTLPFWEIGVRECLQTLKDGVGAVAVNTPKHD